MSTVIDQRIVGLTFDNGKFEKGVRGTLKQLDELDRKLKFNNSSDGLEKVQGALKKINFSAITTGVNEVENQLNRMGNSIRGTFRNIFDEIATGFLRDVGSKISSFVTETIKKFSGLEVIGQGWSQYESSITATKAIMNSTGMTNEEVEEYLDRLVFFSDETSYNYDLMLENLKKLLGIGLTEDQAMKTVEGIATWAARSGASKTEFGIAVNNMVQAISGDQGLQMIDWKSIMRSATSMATPEFKSIVLKVLREMGEISQSTIDAAGNDGNAINKIFTEAMENDLITRNVLINALGYNYGRFADYLYEYMDKNNLDGVTDEIIKELSNTFDEHGIDYLFSGGSFAAAREYNTFTDVIDATNDAIKTQWAQTFQYIFGGYEKAKKLWTSIGENFYELFSNRGNLRNEKLEAWADAGGRDSLMEGLGVLGENFMNTVRMFREGWAEIFYPKAVLDDEGNVLKTPAQLMGERLAETTAKFRDWAKSIQFSDETKENMKKSFKGLFAILDILKQIGSAVLGSIGKVLGHFLPKLAGGLTKVTGGIGDAIVRASQWLRESGVIKRALDKFADIIIKIGEYIGKGVKAIGGFFKALFTGGKDAETANSAVGKFAEGLRGIGSTLKQSVTTIKDAFKNGGLTGGLTALKNEIVRVGGGFYQTIKGKLSRGMDLLRTSFYNGDKSASGFLAKLKEVFPVIGGKVSEAFSRLGQMIKESGIDFQSIIKFLSALGVGGLAIGLIKFANSIKSIGTGVKTIGEGITDFGNSVKAIGQPFGNGVKALGENIVETAKILTNVERTLTTKSIKNVAIAVVAFAAAVWIIINALMKLTEVEDTNKLQTAAIIVGIVAGIVAVLAIALSRIQATTIKMEKGDRFVGATGKLIGISVAIVAYAAAVNKIVKVILKLANVQDTGRLLIGTGIVIGIMVIMAAFLKRMASLADEKSTITKATLAITLLAISLYIVASAIRKIASFKIVDERGNLNLAATLTMLGVAFGIIVGMIGLFGHVLKKLEAFGNEKFNGNNIIKAFGSMLLVAMAVLLLTAPLAILGHFRLPVLIQGGLAFVGIMAVMTFVYKSLSNSSKTMSAGNYNSGKDSWAIIKMAAAMILIANAMMLLTIPLEILGHSKVSTLLKGGLTIAGLLIVMGVVMGAITRISATDGADSWAAIKAATSMVIVAGAMLLLVAPLEIIGHSNWSTIFKGLVGLVGALVMVAVAYRIMASIKTENTTFGPKAASALLILAVAMVVLASSFKIIGSVDWPGIVKSLIAFGAAFGLLVGMAHLLDKTGLINGLDKFANVLIKLGAAAALFGLAAAGFAQLALLFQLVSTLNLKMLEVNAELVFQLIDKIFDIILRVIKNKAPVIAQTVGATVLSIVTALVDYGPAIVDKLLDFINAILVILTNRIDELMGNIKIFVDALGAAFFKNFGEFKASTLWGIIAAMGAFVAIVILLSKFKKQIRGALSSIVIMGLLLGLIVGVFTLMSGIDQNQMRTIGVTLSLVGGVFGGIAIALQALSRNNLMSNLSVLGAIKNAIAIVAAMGILILGTTGIIALMGAISQIPNFDNIMTKGAHAFEMIGNALGSLIGGLVGTIAEVASQHMPEVGNYLSKFMDNMSGFINGANDIKEGSMDSVEKMIEVLGKLVTASIWSNFGNMQKLVGMGEFLDAFGPHVSTFAKNISGIDDTKVNAAAALFDGIGRLLNASVVTARGGSYQQAMGSVDFDSFIAGLNNLSSPLISLSNAGKHIDIDAVTRTTDTLVLIAEAAAKIPNSGGALGALVGNNDLDDFARMISPTVTNINRLTNGLRHLELTDADVESTKLMASMITELSTAAKTIPNSGLSVLSVILGDNKLSDFGEMLPIIGEGLSAFASKTAPLSGGDERRIESVRSVISLIPALAEAATAIPKTEGFVQLWTGDVDFEKFGIGIKTLAEQVVEVYKVMKDVNDTYSLSLFTRVLSELVAVQQGLDFTGKTDVMYLSTFGAELKSFGESLSSFNETTKDVDTSRFSSVATTMSKMIPLVTGIPESLKTVRLGSYLSNLGYGLKTLSEDSASLKPENLEKAVNSIQTLIPVLVETAGLDTSVLATMNDFMAAYAELTSTTFTEVSALEVSNVASAAANLSSHFISGLQTGLTVLPRELSDTLISAIRRTLDNPALITELQMFGKGISSRIKEPMTGEDFGSDLPVFAENLRTFYDKLDGLSIKDLANVNLGLRTLLTETQSFSTEAMNVATTMMTTFSEGLTQYLNSSENTLFVAGQSVVGQFAAGVLSKKDNISALITVPLRESLTNQDLYVNMAEWGKGVIDSFISGLRAQPGAVAKGLKDTINDKVKGTFISNRPDWVKEATTTGNMIILGLANGINMYAELAAAAIRNVGTLTLGALNAVMGVESPSKEAALVGMYTDLGFAEGLYNYSGAVTDASTYAGIMAVNGLNSAIQDALLTFDDTVNTEPTIRPVLDLSDVQAGAQQIDAMMSRQQALSISSRWGAAGENQNGGNSVSNVTYNFTQTNNSPKALSKKEIYRQTRNQFSKLERIGSVS